MILQAAARTHAAQFYEGESFLHRGIVTFFTEPIRQGHHTVIISRPSVFNAVLEQLSAASDAALVEGVADVANGRLAALPEHLQGGELAVGGLRIGNGGGSCY